MSEEVEMVGVLSRCPRKFRLMLMSDRRFFEISPGTNHIPQDFLEAWAEVNWDSEIMDLLAWPGKPATRRAGAHERGAVA